MSNLRKINAPTELNLLIGFADLSNFARISAKKSSSEISQYISKIYELTGDCIEFTGGLVIKFIGDASLIVFPGDKIDEGILALKKLKREIDNFNKSKGFDSQLKVKCHFGDVMIGRMGTKTEKKLDIIGSNVNITALLKSNGFAMTAETFRKLRPETRQLFKKHTPPITYIPVEEMHKD